jgi:hypothetical protein
MEAYTTIQTRSKFERGIRRPGQREVSAHVLLFPDPGLCTSGTYAKMPPNRFPLPTVALSPRAVCLGCRHFRRMFIPSMRELFWPATARPCAVFSVARPPQLTSSASFQTNCCGVHKVFDYLRGRLLGKVLGLSSHLSHSI